MSPNTEAPPRDYGRLYGFLLMLACDVIVYGGAYLAWVKWK